MTKKIEKKSTRSHQGQHLSALWLCFLMFVIGYLAASWFDVNQCMAWVTTHFTSRPSIDKKIATKVEENTPPVEQHPKLEFYTLLTNDASLHVPEAAKMLAETPTVDLQYKNVPDKVTTTSSAPSNSGPMELAVTAPAPAVITPGAPPAQVAQPVAKPVEPRRLASPKPIYTSPSVPAPAQDRFGARFGIQVGSFRSPIEAMRMRDKLSSKGYPAKIISVNQQSIYWYRVMVGPLSSLGQAQQIQNNLSRREHINGMIRKIEG